MQYNFIIYLDNKAKGALFQTLKYYKQGVFNSNVLLIYRRRLRIVWHYWRILSKTTIPFLSFFKYKTLPSMKKKIVLYPFNALSNCRIATERDATHVFVTHGESHKATSIKPIIRIYDYVIVAGDAGIDRFLKHRIFDNCDIAKHKLIRMGDTFIGEAPYNLEKSSSTLLYAPTWEGGLKKECYTSISEDLNSFKLIAQYCKQNHYTHIIIQPHPNTGYRDPRYLYYLYKGIDYLQKNNTQVILRNWTHSLVHKILFRKIQIIDAEPNYPIACAFCDISAIEVQLLNKDIPTFVFFTNAKNAMPDIPLLKQYYTNVGIYNGMSHFKIDPELQKKIKDYYISYEDGLSNIHISNRLEWLKNYIEHNQIK